jgi:hypothetical protein
VASAAEDDQGGARPDRDGSGAGDPLEGRELGLSTTVGGVAERRSAASATWKSAMAPQPAAAAIAAF